MINSIAAQLNSKLESVHLREILSGSALAFVLKTVGLVASYIFILMISRYYGAKGMGIYSLSLAALMILEMLGTLGFGSSILRFVGQYTAEKKHHKIKLLYINMLQFTVPISIFSAIALYFLSHKIAILLFHDQVLVVAFQIISIVLPLFAVNMINIELIRGLKNIALSEYLRNVNRPLLCILFFIIVNGSMSGHFVPVIALSLGVMGTFIVSISYVIKRIRLFSTVVQESLSKVEILRTSLPMMVTTFSFLLMGSIDTVMLGMFSTMENVGIYNVALKLAAVTSLSLYAVNTIAAAKFSELFWGGANWGIEKSSSVFRAANISVLGTISGCLPCISCIFHGTLRQ